MNIIDADAHVIETMETWNLVAEEEPGLVPMITRRAAGQELRNVEGALVQEFWVIDNRVHARDNNVGSNTPEASREMRDIGARLAHMDELDVDVQILFPTLMLRPIADKVRLESVLCRSYNRWLAGIWKQAPERLRWVAVPPLLSMDIVRGELEFAKDHGACGIFMRPLECELPLSDEYFFPLYEIASELDLAISIHLGNGSFEIHDYYNRDTTFTKFKLVTMGTFHSLVFNGTPSRFPDLRWGFIEISADWLPFMINDLRQRLAKRGKSLPDNVLAANRIYVTCQVEDDLPYVLKVAGEDNLVIGTDYGHADFSSQIEALDLLQKVKGLEPGVIEKILYDNPKALYGLA